MSDDDGGDMCDNDDGDMDIIKNEKKKVLLLK